MLKILSILNIKEKTKLFFVFVGLVISGLLEMIGIGILPSIIFAVQDYNQFVSKIIYLPLQNLLKDLNKEEALSLMAISIFVIFLVKNIVLFLLIYIQNKIMMNLRVNLSEVLLSNYLLTEYQFFIEKNRPDIIRNFSLDLYSTVNYISAFLLFVREILVVFFLISLVIFQNPTLIFTVIFLFIFITFILYKIFKKKILGLSKKSIYLKAKVIQIINDYFLSIKDVKILGIEKYLTKLFKDKAVNLAKIDFYIKNVNAFPRLFLEVISVGLLAGIIVYLVGSQKEFELLPNLVLIAAITIRFLPAFSQINSSINSLRALLPSVNVITNEINKIISKKDKVTRSFDTQKIDDFQNSLEFKNVSFSYKKNNETVVENLNLKIDKGEFIGIIGTSGSGKTTLINLLAGLLKPTSGEIFFDSKDSKNLNINSLISYVPQDIFLLDETIDKNIAFGIERNKIDYKKIEKIVNDINIDKIYYEWMNKKDALGDFGGKLSGGQKQRIGIARALYKESPILLLDESTSSLDKESEDKFIQQIVKIRNTKTIIIVSHRDNALKFCEKIYKLENKNLRLIK